MPAYGVVLTLSITVFWLAASAYMLTEGAVAKDSTWTNVYVLQWDSGTKTKIAFHVIAFIWLNTFLVGCTQMVVAASASMWYFSQSNDVKGRWTVIEGFCTVLVYHLGSVAFGSAIIFPC